MTHPLCPPGAPYKESQLAPPSAFKQGDKVRVSLDVAVFKLMQEGHGGWNEQMTQVKKNGRAVC